LKTCTINNDHDPKTNRLWSIGEKEIMKLAINSIVFVAAIVLAGCEKKVEAPAVADAGLPEKPACCEPAAPAPAVEADAAPAVAPVAPLAAPATEKVTAPTTTVTK